MIGHSNNTSESWRKLPWKKLQRNLFRLQRRIYKAVREGDKLKARSLQKLLFKSTSAQLLAIRQVTQLNTGKRTSGIDRKKALTFSERFELLEMLKKHSLNWAHQGLREIPIPKKNGKTRILKVPTISDRAWQCLAKYALEPAHEATFHPRSYGFRIGRSAHDAQKYLQINLKSDANGLNKRVFELDIKSCFDRISHKAIMDNLIAPQSLKIGIFRCLKAGVNPEFPEQGTQQGGVVSPLLANIALNGIEDLGVCVRYADDMVFILKNSGDYHKDTDEETKLKTKIEEFLAKRGMEVSQEKTRVTATTEGFDFLGWHFQVQKNGKFRSTPSVENFKAFREKVKLIVNSSNYGACVKAQKLAPVVRGWRNYHRHCKMDGARNSLYHIETRAFRKFNKESKQNCYSSKKLLDQAFPKVPYSENRHIMVKGDKSPFDGDITYWSKRENKHYNGVTSKLLNKQNHTCSHCGLKFLPSEEVQLHHIDENHHNWKPENLTVLHRSCHQYIHMSRSKDQNI